jgi:hypothetical protein
MSEALKAGKKEQKKERGMLKKGIVSDIVVLDGSLDPKNQSVAAETWTAGCFFPN